jgi:YD repeat-containing protein
MASQRTDPHPTESAGNVEGDADGNVTSRIDSTGTTIFVYDTENRLVTEELPGGANACRRRSGEQRGSERAKCVYRVEPGLERESQLQLLKRRNEYHSILYGLANSSGRRNNWVVGVEQ